jgi:hypothetical protein
LKLTVPRMSVGDYHLLVYDSSTDSNVVLHDYSFRIVE